MRPLLLAATCLLASALPAQEKTTPEPTPEKSATPNLLESYEGSAPARSKALELAGAFTNEGFKIRDGFVAGKIAPGETRTVVVNLFAGNEYWFCAGAGEKGRGLEIAVYDGGGNRLETEPFEGERTAGAGIIPGYSGAHYVVLGLTEGEATEYVLLYAYK